MADTRPVGVFDSGVGGLSVLHDIAALLPQENLLYCADSGYAPYGERPPEAICARSLELCQFLLDQGAKALVIACNTATAAAATAIRDAWPAVPVIAMEPAVKPATLATRTGVVGVLATTGTLESARFAALLDHFGQGVEVITRPGTGLVEHIERGAFADPQLEALLREHLAPMLDAGADVIVLGCTHYVFIRDQIARIAGPSVQLIDTGRAVARQLQRELQRLDLLNVAPHAGTQRHWCSGDSLQGERVINRLYPGAGAVARLPASVCLDGASA